MVHVDAHIHLFQNGFRGRYGISPAGTDEVAAYQRLRTGHGIGRALVVGYEGETAYRGNNRYLAGLAAEHDWVVALAYSPAGGPVTLDGLNPPGRGGFAGISVYLPDQAAAHQFADWDKSIVDELNRRGALISLNATQEALAVLPPALAALGGCPVLVSHLGLPGRYRTPPTVDEAAHRLAPLIALAALTHVHVKVSGLYAISEPAHGYPHHAAVPFLRLLLQTFGPRRLCWGSDFPPALDQVSFAQTLDATDLLDLSPAERADVNGGNLNRLLG